MNDGVFRRELTLVSSDVDVFRRMRLHALFRNLQESSIAHTEALGAGRQRTLDKGALWVVSRMRVQVSRMPEYDETVTLESWPGETMRVIFPRYYRILSGDGTALVEASGMWVLMDAETRKLAFPDELDIRIDGMHTGHELPLPDNVSCEGLPRSKAQPVHYSDIDLNGHVNNTRYLDWMEDLFTPDFHRTHTLRELQINYLSEIRFTDSVTLHWQYENNVCRIKGDKDGAGAFTLRAQYQEMD